MEATSDPLQALWDKADKAAGRGDMPGTLFVWKALVDQGVWQLCARIGELYETGAVGIDKDAEQAVHWYRRAVFEGDDAIAHLGLGRAHYNGRGAEVNRKLALQHYLAAYRYGLPASGIYLGLMHYQGVEVPKDAPKAEHYFQFAADAGYPAAFAALAKIALSQLRIFRAGRLFVRGVLLGVRIARKDPNDPRLIGM